MTQLFNRGKGPVPEMASKPKSYPYAALHIVTLFAFAVVQPLLSVLASHPTFFVARRSHPLDILVMIAVLSLAIPLSLVLIEQLLARLGRIYHDVFHVSLVSVLTYFLCLPLAETLVVAVHYQITGVLEPHWAAYLFTLILAALLTAGFVLLYTRQAFVRSFVTLLSPGILLFPGLFLFHSPIAELVFSSKPDRAQLPEPIEVKNPAPVVFIVFDELNGMSLMDDQYRIDPVRYPNLAKLATEATWFRNATTNDASTNYAITSMLTGKFPDYPSAPILSLHPKNLFTLLRGTYQLKVREFVTRLCPDVPRAVNVLGDNRLLGRRLISLLSDLSVIYGRVILPERLDRLLPEIGDQWGNFVEPHEDEDQPHREIDVSALIQRHRHYLYFVNEIAQSEQPTLFYIHNKLPHMLYEFLPSGHAYMRPRLVALRHSADWSTWVNDELAVLHNQQRYLLQLGFVDHLVGKLIDRLKAAHLYESSLIVLVSDHGVSFQPGVSRRKPTETSLVDILPILLMIKAPHQQEGAISDRSVESIDVLPTIADVLGISTPWPMDGQSALDTSIPEREHKTVTWKEGKGSERVLLDRRFPERYRSIDRQLQDFAPGTDPLGLFRIGPHSECVGRMVEEFEIAGDANVTVCIENEVNSLAQLCEPQRKLQVLLYGRVETDENVKRPIALAFAVAGTIRAVSRTYRLDGLEDVWHVMMPEDAMTGEQCNLEVFVISPDGETVRLSPTRLKI